MPASGVLTVLFLAASAAAAQSTDGTGMVDVDGLSAALAAGDACEQRGDGDAYCTLNMLQRRGEKLLGRTQQAAADDDSHFALELSEPKAFGKQAEVDDDSRFTFELPEPNLDGYLSGVALQELGVEELQQLAEDTREELARRANVSKADSDASSDSSTQGCPYRMYSGRRSGSELCFCQLAGNRGCAGTPCACPQGCRHTLTVSTSQNVVFPNRNHAHGCAAGTVLLTAPKSYIATPRDVKRDCGGGTVSMLESLLVDSWKAYQQSVDKGPVNQCFHASRIASVKYLHLQTFCINGDFHALPTHNPGLGHCVKMHALSEAPALAADLARQLP